MLYFGALVRYPVLFRALNLSSRLLFADVAFFIIGGGSGGSAAVVCICVSFNDVVIIASLGLVRLVRDP